MDPVLLSNRPNSGIGKNLSYLPARLDLESQALENCSLSDLLSFNLNSVENLFDFDPASNMFRFEHKYNDHAAKANTRVDPSQVLFSAVFVQEHITQFGISYVGVIRIDYPSGSFNVKLPGEMSYDPGYADGDKMWVDAMQAEKIVLFASVLVKAALLGAPAKFIRRLYTVMKPIISEYYAKTLLFKWMYNQVSSACVKQKQPQSYAAFLKDCELETENVKKYLHTVDLVLEGQIEEILPPVEYFQAINEEPEFRNKGKHNESGILREMNDDNIPCISPDLDEDVTPSVEEILEDLGKVKKKYESEMTVSMRKIGELGIGKGGEKRE
jgi:hypothetical protein